MKRNDSFVITADRRHPLEQRALMALAEAGYPDATVTIIPPGFTSVHQTLGWSSEDDLDQPATWRSFEHALDKGYATGWGAPLPVIWRSFTVAKVPWMKCWLCFELEMITMYRSTWQAPCLATGLGLEDCGCNRLSSVIAQETK